VLVIILRLASAKNVFAKRVSAACYYTGVNCTNSGWSLNSKCFIKSDYEATWYTASYLCMPRDDSQSESLAVFTDMGRPSDKDQLNSWLERDKTYWIGLIRSWWKTTNAGELI